MPFFSNVAAWMSLHSLINWIRGYWHWVCSLRIHDHFWIDNQLEVFIENRFIGSPWFRHNNKLVISLKQRIWRWLQTWYWQWEVGVWFNEKVTISRWQIMVFDDEESTKSCCGFLRYVWFDPTINWKMDGILFESADACISAVAFDAAFADWGRSQHETKGT